MRAVVLSISLLLVSVLAIGQQDTLRQDTVRQVLSLADYIQLVQEFHPVVKQARLVTQSADAQLLEARGGFDPKISSSLDLKNFKDTRYYDIFNTTLKFQTLLPIDPKISLDRNEGVFLNPERSIPEANDNRQLSAGISLPLSKGLLIDERRLALNQAKIYQDLAEAEQTKMLNKIFLTAIKDYWNWYTYYRESLLLLESVNIAQELFSRVLIDFEYGELSAIDTVQAKITFLTRRAEYEKILFDLENSRLILSNHLWSPDERPLELQLRAVPDLAAEFDILLSTQIVQDMISWAEKNHPDILKLNYKIQQYEVQSRWYRESLKPQIDLSYSFIDAPITPRGDIESPTFGNNYKLGVDFSFPILLRKERGKLQQNNIKIQDSGYELLRARQSIRNRILSKYAETQTSSTLARQFQDISENYQRLLQAEFLNLDVGESDLFKLNVQQDKYINAQIKYLEYLVKYEKNKVEMLFESGQLANDLNR